VVKLAHVVLGRFVLVAEHKACGGADGRAGC
jgi:hypothetical protein